jgi:hypothetical protein
MSKGGRNYQSKGLLHAPRFTTKPRDCNVCGKPLPTPRPTSKRTCDVCLEDPARLAAQRNRENKRERDLAAERRAANPIVGVMRTCKHREGHRNPETRNWEPLGSLELDPICGVEFEAKPRVDKNNFNRGVHPAAQYCPEHRKPEAVAHRQLLSIIGNAKRHKRHNASQVAHRNRNLTTIQKKQRAAAKAKRDRLAAFLAQPAVRLLRARITLAALLTIKGMKRLSMKDQLYPKTEGGERLRDSTKKFFKDRGAEVDSEVQRLAAFSETRRTVLEASSRQTILDSD